MRIGCEMGLVAVSEVLVPRRDPVKELMMRANEGAAKKYGRKCQILLVIFPDKRHPLYGEVKRVGDNEIGVVTQCVAQPTINLEPNYRSGDTRRRNVTKNISLKVSEPWFLTHQVATSDPKTIAMQMNAKLGGFNAAIDFYEDPRSKNAVMNEPCIIFGADVTHPGAGADNQEPSVAAIVATMDPFACKCVRGLLP